MSLEYFLFSLVIMIVFFIIDSISHQKFSKKVSIIFHFLGIPIWLISMFILVITEFTFTFLIYPGILLIIIGLIIAYKGLVEIKPNLLRAGEVYKKGLFSKIRHPVYSGLTLSMVGLTLAVYSVYFLIYAVVAAIMLYWMAYNEEKHLIRRFGKKYLKYKEEVPMLIPGI